MLMIKAARKAKILPKIEIIGNRSRANAAAPKATLA
jgi:hypothetical protein